MGIPEKGFHALLQLSPFGLINTVAYLFPLDLSPDQPDMFQFLEMLGYGRLGQADFPHQVIADTPFLPTEVLQDSYAGRVRQYAENGGQLVLLRSENLRFGQAHN